MRIFEMPNKYLTNAFSNSCYKLFLLLSAAEVVE